MIGSVGKPLPGNEAKIVDAKPAERRLRPHGRRNRRPRPDRHEGLLQPSRGDRRGHSQRLAAHRRSRLQRRARQFLHHRPQKEIIVLSSGKNIYPEEIESYYLKSPWIKEVCVMGLEGAPGDPVSERLHAVIVPEPRRAAAEESRQHARGHPLRRGKHLVAPAGDQAHSELRHLAGRPAAHHHPQTAPLRDRVTGSPDAGQRRVQLRGSGSPAS